jgi:hypothetical protein
MKGILAATTVILSLFITTNAWAQDPAVAPPGTPPGTIKIYPLDPDGAKQITDGLQNGALNKKPPQDCEAIRQAVEKCQKKGDADGGIPLGPCDALANQFVDCKSAN